jgi:amino acid adenylation domain-containing protein
MTGDLTISPAEAELARQRALSRPHSFQPVASVVSCLAEHAAESPDGLAVVAGQHRITWLDLRNRVAQLRRAFAAAGAGAGDVVAALGPRSADTIAIFLALESIGAVYLPIDPNWPADRVTTVLRRSGAVLVVNYQPSPGNVAGSELRLPDWQTGPSDPLPHWAPDPDEPRYIIFTSGTTGTPKGAVVEQRGMLNHLYAKVLELGLSNKDVVAFTAPLAFDISIWQMLIGVLTGAPTVVFDEVQVSFPRRLLGALRDHEVTVVELVPTVVGWLTDELRRARVDARLPALRWCISTGEELHPPVAEGVLDTLPHVRLLNAYGPTECSDDVTHHVITRSDLTASRLPVGAPIANAVLYLLTRDGDGWRSAGPGEPGELFVGGICVGRGYVADPEVTAAAFHHDVLDPDSVTGRLYRTGDLAVFRDGIVHYLGRGDRQVKVAGVRMELDEIEAVVKRHPDVAHCAVTVQSESDTAHLVAHYVTTTGEPMSVVDLEAFAGRLVPPAMVPQRWVHVERLPMTNNGKVDHKALAQREA